MHLLEIKGLSKSYDGREVVQGVDILVKRGEIVGLLGPNGAGKTTTFYMVVGIIPPNKGTITFDNNDITRLPIHERVHYGIGYLSQEPSIFRKLTVEE
ncbi:MAG: ATP-binding cassette domain-containing protein, partial [Candidatus Omnitrophica bacterium]|nr:ATP-binding cassette domain-containing protein [Candidatus Omnitrophota bacterium]